MAELTEFGRLRTSGLEAQLPRAELERQIAEFLRMVNVCVLATCLDDVPRATPIEFYANGLTIYVAASRGTKLPNMESNARVSVAVCSRTHTDWTDWHDVTAAQITGEPELLRYEERPADYREALRVYDWRKYRRALGIAEQEPRKTTFVRIRPLRIEFRDLALMRKGYAVVQVWESGSP